MNGVCGLDRTQGRLDTRIIRFYRFRDVWRMVLACQTALSCPSQLFNHLRGWNSVWLGAWWGAQREQNPSHTCFQMRGQGPVLTTVYLRAIFRNNLIISALALHCAKNVPFTVSHYLLPGCLFGTGSVFAGWTESLFVYTVYTEQHV